MLVSLSFLCRSLPCLLLLLSSSSEIAPLPNLADLLAASSEHFCAVAAPASPPSVHNPASLRLPQGSHCPVLCDAVDYRQAQQTFRFENRYQTGRVLLRGSTARLLSNKASETSGMSPLEHEGP